MPCWIKARRAIRSGVVPADFTARMIAERFCRETVSVIAQKLYQEARRPLASKCCRRSIRLLGRLLHQQSRTWLGSS